MLRLDVQLMRNFWRNWIRESGDCSKALDGAFLADRAKAHQGGQPNCARTCRTSSRAAVRLGRLVFDVRESVV